MHTFAIIAFLLITAPIFGQDTEIASISDALSQGNASRLSAFFDRSVDLMIEGEGEVLSRDQARMRLDRFFANHEVTSFAVVHKGAAKGNASNYCIGDLKLSKKTYRVYLYLKPTPSSEGAFRIVELRFDS